MTATEDTFTPGDRVRIGNGARVWTVEDDMRDLGVRLVRVATAEAVRMHRTLCGDDIAKLTRI